jgi:hypothetical protein
MQGVLKMNKKLFGSLFILPFCLALLFGGCLNPTQGDTAKTINTAGTETPDEPVWEDLPDDTETSSDSPSGAPVFTIIGFQPILSTAAPDDIKKDAVVGAIPLPEQNGPWTATLIEDAGDSDKFTLETVTTPLQSVSTIGGVSPLLSETPAGSTTVKIKIKADNGLTLGPYKIYLTISNETTTLYRTLTFNVAATPGTFTKPPVVYPYIIGNFDSGKNKLMVKFDEYPSGAQGLNLYIGTDSDPANSAKHSTYTGNDDSAALKEITSIPGDTETANGLLDGTTYYIWGRAFNAEGEGPFSPVATRKTSDPIDSYWWTDIDWWDTIDSYEFYFNTNSELVIGYDTRGIKDGKAAQRWIVRHHISFDPQELNEKIPATKIGHYTTEEDLTGAPAGVFIVETNRETDPFYAVYYWGHKTIQTGSVSKNNPSYLSEKVSLTGTIHSYLSNAWHDGGGYQATLGKAIDNYGSIERFKWYVALVAVPWYPVKDGRYKYGTPVK